MIGALRDEFIAFTDAAGVKVTRELWVSRFDRIACLRLQYLKAGLSFKDRSSATSRHCSNLKRSRRLLCNKVLGATTSHSGEADHTIDSTNSWISQVLVLFVSGDACSQSTRWTKQKDKKPPVLVPKDKDRKFHGGNFPRTQVFIHRQRNQHLTQFLLPLVEAMEAMAYGASLQSRNR